MLDNAGLQPYLRRQQHKKMFTLYSYFFVFCYVSILCREHAVVKVCVGLGTKNTLLGLEKDHVCLQVIPNILSGFI